MINNIKEKYDLMQFDDIYYLEIYDFFLNTMLFQDKREKQSYNF